MHHVCSKRPFFLSTRFSRVCVRASTPARPYGHNAFCISSSQPSRRHAFRPFPHSALRTHPRIPRAHSSPIYVPYPPAPPRTHTLTTHRLRLRPACRLKSLTRPLSLSPFPFLQSDWPAAPASNGEALPAGGRSPSPRRERGGGRSRSRSPVRMETDREDRRGDGGERRDERRDDGRRDGGDRGR